jgi:hypothetical protein
MNRRVGGSKSWSAHFEENNPWQATNSNPSVIRPISLVAVMTLFNFLWCKTVWLQHSDDNHQTRVRTHFLQRWITNTTTNSVWEIPLYLYYKYINRTKVANLMWWRYVPLETALNCLIIKLQSVFPSPYRLITCRTLNVMISKAMVLPFFIPTT